MSSVIFVSALLTTACSTTAGRPAPGMSTSTSASASASGSASAAPHIPSDGKATPIIGIDWQWVGSRYANDRETRPAEPGRYRLRLEPNGSLRARLDCNQGGGRYRIDGSAIAIEVMYSTRAACDPASLDSAFQRDLAAAANYRVGEGALHLQLKSDGGTMEFVPTLR